jgi:hypothetical protein
LFEPIAINFLIAGRDGWWAAMRICQLLQRRRSLLSFAIGSRAMAGLLTWGGSV